MDDVSIGRLLRSIRIRLGMRQADVAGKAGVSQQLVSDLELGGLGPSALQLSRRVAAALGAELVVGLRWRGAELDRLRDDGHATLVARVAAQLEAAGWLVAVEVTFSVYGERGSIDILAFDPVSRTLLVVEVKTELVSAEETLRRLDVKVRLAPRLAAERFGWRAARTSRLLAVADTRTNRRRVERHAGVFQRAFPIRGREVARWLREPGETRGLLRFVSDTTRGGARRAPVGVRRVRRRCVRTTAGGGRG